jgi:c-di-GMP phosphodiesterase
MPYTLLKDSDPSTVSISRHPIFDANKHLWGYGLTCLCRATPALSGLPDEEEEVFKVAAGTSMGLQRIHSSGKKIIIDFTEKSILTHLPYVLPSTLTAVRVVENVYLQPTVPEALAQLKSDGYLVIVGGFSSIPELAPLYRLADILSVEVWGKPRETIEHLVGATTSYKAKILAHHVDSESVFRLCRELGFSLFHGAFYKSPEIVTVKTLSSNVLARLNLMKMIETEEPDIKKLSEVIQSDVSISFRLLAYLNSAAVGLPQKVKSILHAITLLGWRNTKNWLRVLLVTDMNQGENAPELLTLAVQRGKFLELLAKEHDFWGFNAESLQLMGLFSLLDAMLNIPMEEIVSHLPLEDKLKSALLGETNNEYQPLLGLVKYLEDGKWPEADASMQRLNLNREKVKAAYQTAIDWADALNGIETAVE